MDYLTKIRKNIAKQKAVIKNISDLSAKHDSEMMQSIVAQERARLADMQQLEEESVQEETQRVKARSKYIYK